MILNKALIAMLPGIAKTGEVREALLPCPCPFCGSERVVTLHENTENIAVVCNAGRGGCGARGPYARSVTAAIAAWNRCPPSAEVERLQARLGEAEGDARRYRWLRKDMAWTQAGSGVARWVSYLQMPEPPTSAAEMTPDSTAQALDTAIDAITGRKE